MNASISKKVEHILKAGLGKGKQALASALPEDYYHNPEAFVKDSKQKKRKRKKKPRRSKSPFIIDLPSAESRLPSHETFLPSHESLMHELSHPDESSTPPDSQTPTKEVSLVSENTDRLDKTPGKKTVERMIKDLKSPERTGTEETAGDKMDSKLVRDKAVDSKPAAMHTSPEGEKTRDRRIRGEGKPRTSTGANIHVVTASESKSLQGFLPMRQQTAPDFAPAAESSRESNPNSHPSRSNTVSNTASLLPTDCARQ